MNRKIQSLLLPFYFGSVAEDERISVERELLTDSEVLVDFLDLKRKLEIAVEVPQQPSKKLWCRLQEKRAPRKKMILSISVVTAIAASVIIFSVVLFKNKVAEPSSPDKGSNEILFDSSHELPASSNVL